MNLSKHVASVVLVSAVGFTLSAAHADEEKKGLVWQGDFRYRHEFVEQEAPAVTTVSSYHQDRIRARLGAKANVNEMADVEFRLTTAPGRVSTNQTLGAGANGFGNYSITLDRAAFKVKPIDMVSLTGGRIANPYFVAGDSDLVWDTDLNFDGLSLAVAHSVGDFTPFFNTNLFWVDKTTNSALRDVTLISAQIGVRHKLNDDMSWAAGVAMHHYANLNGHALLSTAATPNGNSTIATGAGASAVTRYATDFNLINPGAEFQMKVVEIPTTLMFDFVSNGSAGTENTGFLAGFKLSKLKKSGDWAFTYDYRSVKKDATVGSFTDGDSFGGVTNGKSHRIGAGYMIADNWTASLTTYLGKSGIAAGETEVKRNKVHADLVFKF